MKISVTNLKNIFKKVIGSENESVSSEEPKSEQVQQIEKVQQKAEKVQENQAQPVKVIKDSQPEKQPEMGCTDAKAKEAQTTVKAQEPVKKVQQPEAEEADAKSLERQRKEQEKQARKEKEDRYLNRVKKQVKAEASLNLNEELREKYADFLKTRPIQEKCILYEAFGGRGMTCSPHAIFKYLLAQPEFHDYLHVWVIDDFQDNKVWMEQYASNENVKFVKYQSLEYREYLATAKYLINNVSFPGYFTKREGQVFIDTWHGIPLKTIGFDIPSGKVSAGNTVKNLLAADYLISPNAFMTSIYKNAFKLENIYPGTILEIGQPRNDGYFHTKRQEILDKLKMAGVHVEDGKKIILYAPTWKGSKYSSPDTSLDSYQKIIQTVEAHVDTSKYQVLVKPHQIVYYHIKDTLGVTGQYIPATVDTNELLSVTDILISDYSSIYFDFLVSGKPVLFFIPDLSEYVNYRGLYFGVDKLPGPIAENYEQLGMLVEDAEKAMKSYKAHYKEEALWACPRDDGEVCRRLVEAVFEGKSSEYAVKCECTKKKILLYAGDLSENEVTRSFLCLTKYLDYEKYDFTLLVDGDGDEKAPERISSLPDGIRVLYRGQPFNGTPGEIARHRALMSEKVKRVVHDFYIREGKRLFGGAGFDCAIDFTGENNLFSMVISHMENTAFHVYTEHFAEKERIEKELAQQSVITVDGRTLYMSDCDYKNPTVLNVDTIMAPDTKKVNYICMDQKKAENVIRNFVQMQDENACLYITGKGRNSKKLGNLITELGAEDKVVLTGWLEHPFSFMRLCKYYICPKGNEKCMDTLAAKTMKMKLLAEDCKTEISYTFDPDIWNQNHYRKLSALTMD